MEQGCAKMHQTRAILLVTAALLAVAFVAGPARAMEIFEYQLTASVPTNFQPGQDFYGSNPCEIEGRFGQGPNGNWAETTGPATIRLYVDEQHNQLTRIDILNFDANLRTFPQPGDQVPNDFNHIHLNASIDLSSLSTSILVPSNGATTGGLSAQINGSVGHVGSLVASSSVFGNQSTFDVSMMTGALLGNFAGYGGLASPFLPGPNGTMEPFFSTWLAVDGSYVSPVTGQVVNYQGLFDMNGYLTFVGFQTAPVPEPNTLLLLALGSLGLLAFSKIGSTVSAPSP
jgi:hypothetical protein